MKYRQTKNKLKENYTVSQQNIFDLSNKENELKKAGHKFSSFKYVKKPFEDVYYKVKQKGKDKLIKSSINEWIPTQQINKSIENFFTGSGEVVDSASFTISGVNWAGHFDPNLIKETSLTEGTISGLLGEYDVDASGYLDCRSPFSGERIITGAVYSKAEITNGLHISLSTVGNVRAGDVYGAGFFSSLGNPTVNSEVIIDAYFDTPVLLNEKSVLGIEVSDYTRNIDLYDNGFAGIGGSVPFTIQALLKYTNPLDSSDTQTYATGLIIDSNYEEEGSYTNSELQKFYKNIWQYWVGVYMNYPDTYGKKVPQQLLGFRIVADATLNLTTHYYSTVISPSSIAELDVTISKIVIGNNCYEFGYEINSEEFTLHEKYLPFIRNTILFKGEPNLKGGIPEANHRRNFILVKTDTKSELRKYEEKFQLKAKGSIYLRPKDYNNQFSAPQVKLVSNYVPPQDIAQNNKRKLRNVV